MKDNIIKIKQLHNPGRPDISTDTTAQVKSLKFGTLRNNRFLQIILPLFFPFFYRNFVFDKITKFKWN